MALFDSFTNLFVLVVFGIDLRDKPPKPVFEIIHGIEESHSADTGIEQVTSEAKHDESHDQQSGKVPEHQIENLIGSLERS